MDEFEFREQEVSLALQGAAIALGSDAHEFVKSILRQTGSLLPSKKRSSTCDNNLHKVQLQHLAKHSLALTLDTNRGYDIPPRFILKRGRHIDAAELFSRILKALIQFIPRNGLGCHRLFSQPRTVPQGFLL